MDTVPVANKRKRSRSLPSSSLSNDQQHHPKPKAADAAADDASSDNKSTTAPAGTRRLDDVADEVDDDNGTDKRYRHKAADVVAAKTKHRRSKSLSPAAISRKAKVKVKALSSRQQQQKQRAPLVVDNSKTMKKSNNKVKLLSKDDISSLKAIDIEPAAVVVAENGDDVFPAAVRQKPDSKVNGTNSAAVDAAVAVTSSSVDDPKTTKSTRTDALQQDDVNKRTKSTAAAAVRPRSKKQQKENKDVASTSTAAAGARNDAAADKTMSFQRLCDEVDSLGDLPTDVEQLPAVVPDSCRLSAAVAAQPQQVTDSSPSRDSQQPNVLRESSLASDANRCGHFLGRRHWP